MLPMTGQALGKTHPGSDIMALSACIITSQFVMAGIVAAVGGHYEKVLGVKQFFWWLFSPCRFGDFYLL
jgi:hypothetical protein